ncbi:hypothetical protein [Fibrella aquatilis]|uniref:Uncharacterized protein n=1 Tax=Fibrella aquatilis TaxID=2817059 RepID=A0A939GD09_9BACT|nr:hypothetical protein [Fibrella aquatilis]MBO0934590.1 hypothetical protein [Fibrella aquatilis]
MKPKQHKMGRDKQLAVRATQDEIDRLNAICAIRKEKKLNGRSQADVLFMGMTMIELGRHVWDYRQRLANNIQSCITEKQMIRDDAKKRPLFSGQPDYTPDEAEKLRYLDGCKDAYIRMKNEMDDLLTSYNQ